MPPLTRYRKRRRANFHSLPEDLWCVILGKLDEYSLVAVRQAHPALRSASHRLITSLRPSDFTPSEFPRSFAGISSIDLRESVGVSNRSLRQLLGNELSGLRHLQVCMNPRLASQAFSAIGRLAHLESLEMVRRSWRMISLPDVGVLGHLRGLSTLTCLKLDMWGLEKQEALQPIFGITTLRELTIQRWNFGPGKIHPNVLRGINRLLNMRELRFPCEWNPSHDVRLGNHLLHEIAEALPNITRLDICQWPISDLGIASVAKFCTNLTSLNVSKTGISGQGVRDLAGSLARLTQLDLSGVWYHGYQSSPQAPQQVLEALAGFTQLRVLNLQNWIYSERFPVDLTPLTTLTGLTDLNLSDNWIEYSALDFASMAPLAHLRGLRRLDLSDNNMSRDSIMSICQVLTNLVDLDISNFKALVIHRGLLDTSDDIGCETPLSDGAVELMSQSLTTLSHLTINHCGVRDNNVAAFSGLSKLTSLECYDFSFLYDVGTSRRRYGALTDRGLNEWCEAMPLLSKLDLQLANVRNLSCLGHLECLAALIAPEQITDECLLTLPFIPTLRNLTFRCCTKLKGPGFASVAREPLTELVLYRCTSFRDDALRKHVCKLTNLQKLELDFSSQISDEGLLAARSLTRLKGLSFEQCCRVSMRCLEGLTSLTRLVRMGFTYHPTMPTTQDDWHGFLSGRFPHLRFVTIRHADWLDGSKGLYMDCRGDQMEQDEVISDA